MLTMSPFAKLGYFDVWY